MKITTIDGIQYVKLCDLERLSKELRRGIYHKYPKDEKGCRHLPDFESGIISGYSHFMTEVLIDEIHACDSPDEIRKLHEDLESDFYKHKWVVRLRDKDELMYYERYCPGALRARMESDGETEDAIQAALIENPEGLPTFTTDPWNANYFDWHDIACLICNRIKREYPDLDVEVIPAAMTSGKECKKRLDAILSEGKNEKESGK